MPGTFLEVSSEGLYCANRTVPLPRSSSRWPEAPSLLSRPGSRRGPGGLRGTSPQGREGSTLLDISENSTWVLNSFMMSRC